MSKRGRRRVRARSLEGDGGPLVLRNELTEAGRAASREETRVYGAVPVRRARGLSEAERQAAEMVRRAQGEPPPW